MDSTSSSVTASPSTQGWTYDVFLSFRGPDTRNTFVDYLYSCLERRGLRTFKDEERLEKGDCISASLQKAIQESQFFIAVFSKDYASSKWCLEELATIMELHEKFKKQTVVPIFYHVVPSDVRHQKGSFEDSFKKLENVFKDKEEKVRRWKEALKKTGSLKGYHLHKGYNNGQEATWAEEVAADIHGRSNRESLAFEENLVGLESRVNNIIDRLIFAYDDDDVDADARFIGICDMGGMGKTTIAMVVFNRFSHQFDGACFLNDVRDRNVIKLQKTLLTTILKDKSGVEISNVLDGKAKIKKRLKEKKVLIVLDDVDNPLEQLDNLAGGRDWFGRGSRVIITTRNEGVLRSHGVNEKYIYPVHKLGEEEGLQLFKLHAFKKKPKTSVEELCGSVVRYCEGLPLALKVLGSSLSGLESVVWKGTLKDLKDTPNKTIHEKLKISYDRLDSKNKKIFLHIVCFFRHEEEKHVKDLLESCNLLPATGFLVLIENSLISVKEGRIEMHDLIQELGWHIARQEKKRSRVWEFKEVDDVLCGKMDPNHIECIVSPYTCGFRWQRNENISSAFKALKILIGKRSYNKEDNDFDLVVKDIYQLPSSLEIIHFSRYPFPLLPISFHHSGMDDNPLELLEISRCRFCSLENCRITKELNKLTYLNLSFSESLLETPDFDLMPNLITLYLVGCCNLKVVHPSIGNLRKLVSLGLSGCNNLEELPCFNQVSCLEDLDLENCIRLNNFPEIRGIIPHLVELELREVGIIELDSSIQQLQGLTKLYLDDCEHLVGLSNGFCELKNLKVVMINDCTNLKSLPENLQGLISLEYLKLSGSYIHSFPESFNQLPCLQYLDIRYCVKLRKLPELPETTCELYADSCFSYRRHIDELADYLELQSVAFSSSDEVVRYNFAKMCIHFPSHRKTPFSVTYPIYSSEDEDEVPYYEVNFLRIFQYRCYKSNGIAIDLNPDWYCQGFVGFVVFFLTGLNTWGFHSYNDIVDVEHCTIIVKLSCKDNRNEVLERKCAIVRSSSNGYPESSGSICSAYIPFSCLWPAKSNSVTSNDFSRFEVNFMDSKATANWGCSLLYRSRRRPASWDESREGSTTDIGPLSMLEYLNLSGKIFKHLPEDISRLSRRLQYLDISGCRKLRRKLPELPLNIKELYANSYLASENNIAKLATEYSELYSVSFSEPIDDDPPPALVPGELAKKFIPISKSLLNRNTPFVVTYPLDPYSDYNISGCFKYPHHDPHHDPHKISISLDPTWYDHNFVGFVVCFVFPILVRWKSQPNIRPFMHCELIAKLKHKGNGSEPPLETKCVIGRLYDEEFQDSMEELVCFAYIPFSSLWPKSKAIMDNITPNHYLVFEAAIQNLEISQSITDDATPHWSCGLLYTDDESLTEAIRKKREASSSESDLGPNRTELWEITKIVDQVQCQVVSMTECCAEVARLLYTNSGVGILAFNSNGIQKLWKCPNNEQNPTGKQYWQPNSGLLMINDVGFDFDNITPCIDLSKNDSYIVSAGDDGEVSFLDIMTFEVLTTYSPPDTPTFLVFCPCDNNIIAIGMADGTIIIYNVTLKKVEAELLEGHHEHINGLAFSTTDPKMLVSSSYDAQVCVWNIVGRRQNRRLSVHIQSPDGEVCSGCTDVMFHTVQLHLLLVTHETQLAIYDTSNMERKRQWIPQGCLSAQISFATYSCNSQLVYASFIDGNIGVLDADNLTLRCCIVPSAYLSQPLLNSEDVVFAIVIAAHPQKPNQLAIGLTDGSIKVIEPLESEGEWGISPPIDIEILNERIDDEEASMAEKSVIDAALSGEIHAFTQPNPITGEEIQSDHNYHIEEDYETTTSQHELGPNETKLWESTAIVDRDQCRMVSMPECSDAKVARLLYTNSGVSILALSLDGIQKLWKWPNNEQNPTGKATANSVPQHWQPNSGLLMINDVEGVNLEKVVPCIALSNDGSYIVSATGGKVSLFNIMTFKVTKLITLPSASTFLAFNPHDDNIIVIGTEKSTIYIYDRIDDDEEFNELEEHQKPITGLAFSTNLKLLVSSDADAQLCSWNTRLWKKKRSVRIQLPAGEVCSGDTHVMFHVDQPHLLVTHETQLAIYDASKMECMNQWIPHGSFSAPIASATYSCNCQLIYASFKDGNIGVFDAHSLRPRCRIAPSAYYLSEAVLNRNEGTYAVVIAAHPQEPNQLALGLTDGSVKVIEPLESEGEWGISLPMGAAMAKHRGEMQSNEVRGIRVETCIGSPPTKKRTHGLSLNVPFDGAGHGVEVAMSKYNDSVNEKGKERENEQRKKVRLNNDKAPSSSKQNRKIRDQSDELSLTGTQPPIVGDDVFQQMWDNFNCLLASFPPDEEYIKLEIDQTIFHHTDMCTTFILIK